MIYQKFTQKLAETGVQEHLPAEIYQKILNQFKSASPLQLRKAIHLLDQYLLQQQSDQKAFFNQIKYLALQIDQEVNRSESTTNNQNK